MTFRPAGLLLGALLLASCSSLHDDFSNQLLQPPGYFLAEPTALGLPAEPFTLPLGGDATLSGFWLANPAAEGRTVVLFHDADTNVGALHPWYRYLFEAGFSVCAFDPRGYGRSGGTPGLRGWLYDVPTLLEHLEDHCGVDWSKTAFYGTGLGANVALWAARQRPRCAAIVVEGLTSVRAQLQTSDEPPSALDAYRMGFAEFASLPENFEAVDNAPELRQPALFVLGADEPIRHRRALLAAFDAYQGQRSLWVLPETGRAPHGMSTHDGDYQRTIAQFLRECLALGKNPLAAGWRKVGNASDGAAFYELAVDQARALSSDGQPIAVEAAAISGDTIVFGTTWLDDQSGQGKVRVKLASAPSHVGVARIHAPASDDEGGAQRSLSPLAKASRALNPLFGQVETLRFGEPTLADARQLADALTALAATTPLPPVLESELADVFAKIGGQLAGSKEAADREAATAWLERAVAAAPAHPELHFWAGPITTYGYPQHEAVEAARRRLGGR